MMAGVGGAAAGVNGFFTSEILADINLDWCKKAPRDICNAFRSSTFFNYCPRWWLLHWEYNKSPKASSGQRENTTPSIAPFTKTQQ